MIRSIDMCMCVCVDQDITGSGIETIAHLRQPGNGRLTLSFVAFEGPPRILRIFGPGQSGLVRRCTEQTGLN